MNKGHGLRLSNIWSDANKSTKYFDVGVEEYSDASETTKQFETGMM